MQKVNRSNETSTPLLSWVQLRLRMDYTLNDVDTKTE